MEPDAPLPRLTGFENHGGRTTLGPGVAPLGRVTTGGGNGAGSGDGPDDGPADGALGERLLATYLHGPVLPRNPALADHLLSWIVGDLDPLDSVWEERLRAERIAAGAKTGIAKWVQDRLLARG